ncbi:MAG: tRNA-(ms[2]io[6]A)-hydroxylase [Bacteroidetes bacterium]|nr:tRNA-(ms[2]io[6]A)-hydroxylase [Bacteroidota bacterium]
MQLSIELKCKSPEAWLNCVMENFDDFLLDHADCERKASSMAMSFVAKYPDRTDIIPELIETALEELEHFRDVYALILKRGGKLKAEMDEDPYIKQMLAFCRTGRNERFLDRMLLASLFETRGAERFKLIWERLPEDSDEKKFFHRLWASEAKHAHLFVKMALGYFTEKEVYERLDAFATEESRIIENLPIRAALH